MIEKQLKVIRAIAVKFYDRNPEHFQAVIQECDSALAGIKEDNLMYLEALEATEEYEQFDMREIA